MITAFNLWLIFMCDNLREFFGGGLYACIVSIVCFIIFILATYAETGKNVSFAFKKPAIVVVILAVLCAAARTCTPTTNQVAVIFGLPYILQQGKDMNLDRLPRKMVDCIDLYLDIKIKEAQDKIKK